MSIETPADRHAATVAFPMQHLGHEVTVYFRAKDRHRSWTLGEINPRADRVYEPGVHFLGRAHSIEYGFVRADELACTDCRVTRERTHS